MSFHDDSQADPFAILQQFLDILSDQPGAILYRAPEQWEALHPGDPGSILTLSTALLPVWTPPT